MGGRHGYIWWSDPLCVWIHVVEHVFCRIRTTFVGISGEMYQGRTLDLKKWGKSVLRFKILNYQKIIVTPPSGGVTMIFWFPAVFLLDFGTFLISRSTRRSCGWPLTKPLDRTLTNSSESCFTWCLVDFVPDTVQWGRIIKRKPKNTVNVEFYMGRPLRHTKVTCLVTFKSKFSKK